MNMLRKKRIAPQSIESANNTFENEEEEVTATVSVTKKVEIKRKRGKGKFILSFIIIAALAFLITDYYQKTKELALLKDPAKQALAAQVQSEKILADLSHFIILPKDEVPTFMVMNDAEAAKATQVFYKDAINGDILVIYEKAARAILWSPSRNIIVNTGPITYTPDTATNTSSNTQTNSTPPSTSNSNSQVNDDESDDSSDE